MTPVVKYWVCKVAPTLLDEAMECLGGNGYVEEGPLARYYREAPVNAIWEGSGNVMALDVLRVLGRAPGLFDEVLEASRRIWPCRRRNDRRAARGHAGRVVGRGLGPHADRTVGAGGSGCGTRRLGAGRIADAFIETRLAGSWRSTYGMLDARQTPG